MKSIWGVGPVAPFHLGFDKSILKQKQLIKEGFDHTIFIADLHTALSHGLSRYEIEQRCSYYEEVFASCYGIKAKNLRGSHIQFDELYMSLVYSLASRVTANRALDATNARVKDGCSATAVPISSFLYPLLQCIDPLFLKMDLILADQGQRKIYELATKDCKKEFNLVFSHDSRHSIWHSEEDRNCNGRTMPRIKYFKLMVDIQGRPLSESNSSTRISIHETSDTLLYKVRRMYAPPAQQNVIDFKSNALLCYMEHSVFAWHDGPVDFTTRDGDVRCEDFTEFECRYKEGQLHPQDVKKKLFEILEDRIRSMQSKLSSDSTSWINLKQFQFAGAR